MIEQTQTQTLTWINSFLLLLIGGLFAIVSFFVRDWMKTKDKKDDEIAHKLESKLDAVLCRERHGRSTDENEAMAHHKHAPVRPDGTGGEVIHP
jgi:ABC-type nickel/cobalt efflux system permease component RcnA